MAKTYAFTFNAQLADLSDPRFVSIIYGGSETRLAEETKECTFADALAYRSEFAAKQTKPCAIFLRMANRRERKPAGFDAATKPIYHNPASVKDAT
jgi:hypothetical protein